MRLQKLLAVWFCLCGCSSLRHANLQRTRCVMTWHKNGGRLVPTSAGASSAEGRDPPRVVLTMLTTEGHRCLMASTTGPSAAAASDATPVVKCTMCCCAPEFGQLPCAQCSTKGVEDRGHSGDRHAAFRLLWAAHQLQQTARVYRCKLHWCPIAPV